MRKIPDDKLEKLRANEDNIKALDDFCSDDARAMFLFAIEKSGGVTFHSDQQTSIKGKAVLALRARSPKMPNPDDNIILDQNNIQNEVIFMEVNKVVMDNLYQICSEVFMPILGNPINMVGWSDLVSKDLMDKFHVFLAHTYVTIGQIKGRTLLPLPPSDVTASATTSSKDKAVLLEAAIVHWTK